MQVSDKFTVAAAFGNVHGVYKPVNASSDPKRFYITHKNILKKSSILKNNLSTLCFMVDLDLVNQK